MNLELLLETLSAHILLNIQQSHLSTQKELWLFQIFTDGLEEVHQSSFQKLPPYDVLIKKSNDMKSEGMDLEHIIRTRSWKSILDLSLMGYQTLEDGKKKEYPIVQTL